MSSILIADSGSTKTDWCLVTGGKGVRRYQTAGLNPFFRTHEDCIHIMQSELKLKGEKGDIGGIVFYGAGIKDKSKISVIEKALKQHFSIKNISVYSDMLGAARATCGTERGVCGILGTGSNSCYYNGAKIMTQNPSLGYILGDEGSGTYMGRRVLQYYFYHTFDGDLRAAFEHKYGNNLTGILERIYGGEAPNRYLASFTEFLTEQRGHYMIENIIEDALIDFYQRHILKYRESWKYAINFVGTVAYEFRDIIASLHEQYGLETGKILRAPMDGLVDFHRGDL